jgi:hypothetical protein
VQILIDAADAYVMCGFAGTIEALVACHEAPLCVIAYGALALVAKFHDPIDERIVADCHAEVTEILITFGICHGVRAVEDGVVALDQILASGRGLHGEPRTSDIRLHDRSSVGAVTFLVLRDL